MILATCYNNKLTNSIYDGDREVDWNKAKTIKEEGSSAANMTRQTGRGQEGGGLDRKKKSDSFLHFILQINPSTGGTVRSKALSPPVSG